MTQLLIDRATLEQLVAALEGVEELIEHQYTGTREGMNALQNASDDAQVALTAGLAALANAEPIGWQAIETAPKDGTSFMAGWFDGPSNPGCNMRPVKRYMGAWWESNEDYKVRTPTHWMPLPAAPKEQQ